MGQDFLGGTGTGILKVALGQDFLKVEQGQDFLKVELGQDFLKVAPGQDFIKVALGQDFLKFTPGQDFLKVAPRQDFLLQIHVFPSVPIQQCSNERGYTHSPRQVAVETKIFTVATDVRSTSTRNFYHVTLPAPATFRWLKNFLLKLHHSHRLLIHSPTTDDAHSQ